VAGVHPPEPARIGQTLCGVALRVHQPVEGRQWIIQARSLS
jgi:hypothetical protein